MIPNVVAVLAGNNERAGVADKEGIPLQMGGLKRF